MTLTAEQVREIIRDEVAKPSRKPSRRPNRRFVTLGCSNEEFAAIHAAAAERGCCVADLLRSALEPVLNAVLPQNRFIPINLQSSHKRTRDMNRAELASIAKAGLIASRILARDTGAAVGQTASVPVPKLRGPQRPEKPVPKG